MKVSFAMFITDSNHLMFHVHPVSPEYEMLTYLFSSVLSEGRLDGYQAMIDEIEQIERGEILESPEPWGLIDDPNNEFRIKGETTYFEMLTADGWKYLEMPTAEFKDLLLMWIRFVETNTAAFSQRAKGY